MINVEKYPVLSFLFSPFLAPSLICERGNITPVMMTKGWGHQFCDLPLSGYLFQRIYISWLITVTRI
jgi:hypothetical protein